jgi:secreted trypsin-like serine protease
MAFVEDSVAGAQCSGTVVAPNVVLTAGHCVVDESTLDIYPPADFTVATGAADWTDTTLRQLSAVTRIALDPNWRTFTTGTGSTFADQDIALLELATPTTAPTMPLASDPQDAALYTGGTAGAIAGWGLTDPTGTPPTNLQWADTVIQSATYCQQQAPNIGAQFDAFDQTCAQDAPTNTTSTCPGDSGGPLVAEDATNTVVEIGVTSFGPSPCTGNQPAYFTRVDVLGPWIAATITSMSPPSITTEPATAVGQTSAQLNGEINPNENVTANYFKWGATTAYGNTTPPATTNNGLGTIPASATISGLAPSTTYHFRYVGTSANGTTYGADETFTTAAAPPPRPTLPRMSESDAKGFARQTVKGVFRKTWTSGHSQTFKCDRASRVKFACEVQWWDGPSDYGGTVSVRYVLVQAQTEWTDHYSFIWVNDQCYYHSRHRKTCRVRRRSGTF